MDLHTTGYDTGTGPSTEPLRFQDPSEVDDGRRVRVVPVVETLRTGVMGPIPKVVRGGILDSCVRPSVNSLTFL